MARSSLKLPPKLKASLGVELDTVTSFVAFDVDADVLRQRIICKTDSFFTITRLAMHLAMLIKLTPLAKF